MLYEKYRDGIRHVGFIRQQRFYPVPGASVSDKLLVIELEPGTPGWSGVYSVQFPEGPSSTISHSFSI